MSYHLTYLQAVVTGLIQGVTELFPVSSLGHNVLIPALIGGSWAQTLNVSATGSPYLAFIVGLHVATAVAMIAFFWRDWLRIVRGFFTSIAERRIVTPDQKLAWLIILGTIPVGIVGLLVQKEFTKVFAKPELAATFLFINGLILLGSERMRRRKEEQAGGARVAGSSRAAGPARAAGGTRAATADGPGFGNGPGYGGPAGGQAGGPGYGGQAGGPGYGGQAGGPGYGGRDGRPDGPPPGYSQQPRQQQWQGQDPRNGQDEDWPRRGGGRHGRPDGQGQPDGQQYGQPGQGGQYGQEQYGEPTRGGQQYGQDQYGEQTRGGQQYGQDQYGEQTRGGQQYGQEQYGEPTRGGQQYGQDQYGQGGPGGQYGQDQYGSQGEPAGRGGQYGAGQYEQDPRGGRAQQPPAGGQGYGQRPGYEQPGYEQPAYEQPTWDRQPGAQQDPWRDQARQQQDGDPRGARPQQPAGRPGQPGGGRPGDGRPGGGRPGDGRPGPNGAEGDPAVAADRRLSTIGFKRALFIGAAQILALLPGISRDGIVTVAGMGRGLTRQDAVRFSFLLSAPVILAAGALKATDLTGPDAKGMHGPIIVGSIVAGVGAYLSIRFLTKYFSEDKSLNPFGIYCIIAGLGSLAYLVIK